MPKSKTRVPNTFIALIVMFCLFEQADAQSLLYKKLSISFNHEQLGKILDTIAHRGGFYFSYNGKLIAKDSVVSITANNEKIETLLNRIFQNKYQFEERGNYLIITPATPHLSLINTDINNENNNYWVSGYVMDQTAGTRLINVSVYEKEQLLSTLTDSNGYFKLKLRSPGSGSIAITASKLFYKDTTVRFLQTVLVDIGNDRSSFGRSNSYGNRVEGTGIGKLFISTRQKIQSMNIPDFFAKRPFQISLTPGLSSHRMFSAQVVNKFSLNLVGGYTAGVNGLEIGGLFNINKIDTRYLQLAGIFNLVGGKVSGIQIAGVDNTALDTVKGVQMAGFVNHAEGTVYGLQFAALHNSAQNLKGVQLGLVNIADTSAGASIGLFNIIRNGFYKISWSANNFENTNLSIKTGTHSFYSNLLFGSNISADRKMYSFGLGIGHDFLFSKAVYLSTETDFQFANTGLWNAQWSQAKLELNLRVGNHLSIFAGPTLNHFAQSGSYRIEGYQNVVNLPDYPEHTQTDHHTKNWLGWEAGLAFNSVFNQRLKTVDRSQSWFLGAALIAGAGWDRPYGLVTGGELFTQKDLSGHLTGTFSIGYSNNSVVDQPQSAISFNAYQAIPIKAGIRIYAGKNLYFGGELGEAIGLNQTLSIISPNTQRTDYGAKNSFLYAPSAGYSFTNGIEAGIRFEDYVNFGYIKQFAFRLGYRFRLNK